MPRIHVNVHDYEEIEAYDEHELHTERIGPRDRDLRALRFTSQEARERRRAERRKSAQRGARRAPQRIQR